MIGQQIIQLHQVDSTNNYAAKLIGEGKIKHGTVILAENQTAGKGQRGKTWSASVGKQFTASYYLETVFLSVEVLPYFNMSVSLAVVKAIETLTNERIHIKWPNDIFVLDKKLGGILIETNWKQNQITSAIVGIGVNLTPVPSVSHAISVAEIGTRVPELLEFLQLLSGQLEHHFQLLKTHAFEQIKQDYLLRLWQKGELLHLVNLNTQEAFEGRIVGVDGTGSILIESNDIITAYHNHELSFEKNYSNTPI